MALVPVPLPLGRVAMPLIHRFADKPRGAVRRDVLDCSAWLAETANDPITAASVTVFPCVAGGLELTSPAIEGAGVAITSAEGVSGQDYEICFTYAAASGRVGQTAVRLFVP